MIKNMQLNPRSKRVDITQYRHAYLILHTYSDAFECYRYMTYDIILVQKWYHFCIISFALLLELLSDKELSQKLVYTAFNRANLFIAI